MNQNGLNLFSTKPRINIPLQVQMQMQILSVLFEFKIMLNHIIANVYSFSA